MDSHLTALRELVLSRLPQGRSASSRGNVERFLTDGVLVSPRFGGLPFQDGDLWEQNEDRSLSRFAHAFLWFIDWPAAVAEDERAARAAFDLTAAWRARAGDWVGDSQNLAYHDETTAQRLTMHLALIDGQAQWLDAAQLAELRDFLDETAQLLLTDDFHAGLNNHGMFQDVALVNWAAVADWAGDGQRTTALTAAIDRLNAYFRHAFTSEGVHVEHAPSYHLMVAKELKTHIETLTAIEHPELPEFKRLLSGTVAYATHAVTPQGEFPPISDTTVLPLRGQSGLFGETEHAYAVTAGQEGSEPSSRTLVLPESGYAIHRSSWGDPNATFVYFSCAYNNAYHKHADENSLFVRHRGLDLISEAGPNGYNYQDPLTRYGYSQYAHSTLVVDGRSIARHGGPLDTVTMQDHGSDESGFHVTGRNARLEDTEHYRTVRVRDADGSVEIDVTDEIRADSEHTYELLWHVGAGLDVVLHGHGYELHHQGSKVMDVLFTADAPLKTSVRRGLTGRFPQGWRFPKMGDSVPSDVVVVSFEGASRAVRASIRLSDFNYRDRGVTPRNGWQHRKGPVGLNYLRVPGQRDKLVVAFTSMHQIGDFTFNYKPTVDASGREALYILDDFGNQGSYYLQDHWDSSIFSSVQDLLKEVLNDLGLEPADAIFIGTSKGATAALIHGMTLGAGQIFVGGPQTKIGTFVAKPHPNVLELMTGGTSEADVAALDDVVFRIAEDTKETWRSSQVTILVGDRDHHLKGHVQPFMEHVAQWDAPVTLVTLPGHTHGTFGRVYRDALARELGTTAGPAAELKALSVAAEVSMRTVTATVNRGTWSQYAARLYRDSKQVKALPYGPARRLEFTDLPAGRYRVRVFARSGGGDAEAAETTGWVEVEQPVRG